MDVDGLASRMLGVIEHLVKQTNGPADRLSNGPHAAAALSSSSSAAVSSAAAAADLFEPVRAGVQEKEKEDVSLHSMCSSHTLANSVIFKPVTKAAGESAPVLLILDPSDESDFVWIRLGDYILMKWRIEESEDGDTVEESGVSMAVVTGLHVDEHKHTVRYKWIYDMKDIRRAFRPLRAELDVDITLSEAQFAEGDLAQTDHEESSDVSNIQSLVDIRTVQINFDYEHKNYKLCHRMRPLDSALSQSDLTVEEKHVRDMLISKRQFMWSTTYGRRLWPLITSGMQFGQRSSEPWLALVMDPNTNEEINWAFDFSPITSVSAENPRAQTCFLCGMRRTTSFLMRIPDFFAKKYNIGDTDELVKQVTDNNLIRCDKVRVSIGACCHAKLNATIKLLRCVNDARTTFCKSQEDGWPKGGVNAFIKRTTENINSLVSRMTKHVAVQVNVFMKDGRVGKVDRVISDEVADEEGEGEKEVESKGKEEKKAKPAAAAASSASSSSAAAASATAAKAVPSTAAAASASNTSSRAYLLRNRKRRKPATPNHDKHDEEEGEEEEAVETPAPVPKKQKNKRGDTAGRKTVKAKYAAYVDPKNEEDMNFIADSDAEDEEQDESNIKLLNSDDDI